MSSPRIDVLHDHAPGRLRLRLLGLRGDPAFAARLTMRMQAEQGWGHAEARASTGSVILSFPAAAPVRDQIARLADIVNDLRSAGPAPAAAAVTVEREQEDWHALSLSETLERLGSDPDHGLSARVAAERLQAEGGNLLPQDRRRSGFARFADQFRSLPLMLLSGSSVVSAVSGGVAEAVATLAVVAVNAVVGHVTEGQAESVIHALMDDTADRARASVIREGLPLDLSSAELVRGDLYLVAVGTQLAADARLILPFW